jgi:ubiquinone/menaquinone biosynthesis C-methylase UbiE
MDKEYWNSFYKDRLAVNFPSPFAEFCIENYIPPNSYILELGSGNGRDAFYFSEKQNSVIAVDQSAEVLRLEDKKLEISSEKNRLTIVRDDFVQMDYSKYTGVNVIYSRFTLHAITLEEEDIILSKVYEFLPEDGLFLIEVRTTQDPLCGVGEDKGDNAYFTDHYRRFVDTQAFIKKVMELGFVIVYFLERDGLSVYKDENPVLMRIVLKKAAQ